MQLLDTYDWIAIGIYFALLFGVALWVIFQKTENTEDYFLAGRNVGWFVVGSSIFASNIGSEHVVGLAGTGAAGRVGSRARSPSRRGSWRCRRPGSASPR